MLEKMLPKRYHIGPTTPVRDAVSQCFGIPGMQPKLRPARDTARCLQQVESNRSLCQPEGTSLHALPEHGLFVAV